MEYAYSRVYGCYFNTFYDVEFYVDFWSCVFGLSFQSNVLIGYTCFVYGLSLCDRFMGWVCDSSLRIKCTSVVYWSIFGVDFADPVHGSILLVSLGSNLWTYEAGWRIEITGPFLGQIWWPSLLVRFIGRVLESRLQFVIRIVLYKVKF